MSTKFQSTLPRGERRYRSLSHATDSSFQSTLPRGERQRYCVLELVSFQFQSTLPRGERRPCYSITIIDKSNFNPRSREGSDRVVVSCFTSLIISIHAPARGATPTTAYNCMPGIFQSTLPRGERPQIHTNN